MEIDVSKLDVLQAEKLEESKLDIPVNIYKNFVESLEKEQSEVVNIPIVEQQEDPPEDPLVVIQRTFIDEVCRVPGSIIDVIDTGNPVVMRKKKKNPQFATPLFRETFLSEFKSEQDKKKARENLGIYSKEEVDQLTSGVGDLFIGILNLQLNKYITKDSFQELVSNLEFVKALLVKSIIYDIPLNI